MRFSYFFLITAALALPLLSVSAVDVAASRQEYLSDYQALKTRVEDFYAARKNNNFQNLYEMMSARFREQHSADDLTGIIGPTIGLLAYHIEAITISGSDGLVYLSENIFPSAIPSPHLALNLKQKWVKVDGKWLFDPEELPTSIFCGGDRVRSEAPKVHPCGGGNQSKSTPRPCGK